MKESTVDRQRAIIAHGQSPEIAQPGEGALDDPAPLVAPQGAAILHSRFTPAFPMRNDGFNPTATQLLAQPVAVVATIHNHPLGFLSRPSSAMTPPHADRRERHNRQSYKANDT